MLNGPGVLYFRHLGNIQINISKMQLMSLKQTVSTRVSGDCLEVKGKAVPLQAWSGPELSRKLKFPDFTVTTQGGGKVVSLTHRSHILLGLISVRS